MVWLVVIKFSWILLGFLSMIIVTQFVKTWHNDAFLEIQIFASVSSMYSTTHV